jgi:hypothetical protein
LYLVFRRFERLLQAMDLAQINLLTLPYRVVD